MSSNSSGRGGLEFEFVIRRRFAEFRGALAVCDPVEKTIYERRVIALEESMRDIEILVDDDLCRHVPAGNQFIDARAQNRAKDRVNSLQFPAFGETGGNGTIDFAHIAKALAAFQRTLVSFDTPYDAYLQGDSAAMTRQAVTGSALFDRRCRSCLGLQFYCWARCLSVSFS